MTTDATPATGEAPVSRARAEIVKEAGRIEEDVLYTSKGHFNAAQVWSVFHIALGLPAAVLAAVAAIAALDEKSTEAAVISTIVAGLTAAITFTNPQERHGLHHSAGNHYDGLMNRTRMFRTIDCWQEDSTLVLSERLRNLSEDKNRLNLSSPQVPWWAYKAAKQGIALGQASHQVDQPAADPPAAS